MLYNVFRCYENPLHQSQMIDQTKLVKEINAKISNHEIIKEKLLNITLSGYFAQRTLR